MGVVVVYKGRWQNWQIKGLILLLLSVNIILIASCKIESLSAAKEQVSEHAHQGLPAVDSASALAWDMGLAFLTDSIAEVDALYNSVITLLEIPTASTLAQAQTQWHRAYRTIQTLMPMLHLSHQQEPLLNSTDHWRFMISAWPIQPGFLDSYQHYAYSGIVYDINIPITKKSLRRQHGISYEEEVVLGFHGIEYLLWGQHKLRVVEDFYVQKILTQDFKRAGLSIYELPNNRRRKLLATQTQLLLEDLQILRQQWQAKPKGKLASAYYRLEPLQRLQLINQSVAAYLKRWAGLLKAETASPLPDTRLNEFAGDQEKALIKGIDSIALLYFSPSVLLAEHALETENKEQLNALLEKTRLHLSGVDAEMASTTENGAAEMLFEAATILQTAAE